MLMNKHYVVCTYKEIFNLKIYDILLHSTMLINFEGMKFKELSYV